MGLTLDVVAACAATLIGFTVLVLVMGTGIDLITW